MNQTGLRMGRPTKCAVIGHSHAAFLKRAATALNMDPLDSPEVIFSFGLLQNYKVEESELNQSGIRAPKRDDILSHQRKKVAALLDEKKPDVVVSYLLGNTHNIWCLPQHPRAFDFFVPGKEYLPVTSGAEIVPYGAMKLALGRTIIRELSPIVDAIKEAVPGLPHYFLPPPPPVRSNDYLLNETKDFADEFRKYGVSPPYLRLKFWHMNLEILKDFADENRIETIELPDGAFDEEGFLPENFWSDATHGNGGYNSLILKSLTELCSRGPDK